MHHPTDSLGQFLLRSRLHAVAVTFALTLLSYLASPLAYILSGAPLALICLRNGGVAAIQVALGCLALLLLVGVGLGLPPAQPLSFAAMVWLPVIFCALTLRESRSQGLMLVSVGGIGLLFLSCLYALLRRLVDWWRLLFDDLQTVAVNEVAERLEEVYHSTEQLLTAMFASAFLLNLIVTLLLARWWQSLLFNRGGFREEFYRLRLPSGVTYFALLLTAVLLLQRDEVFFPLRDVVWVMMLLHVFQGLSAIHRFVYARQMGRNWLVLLYCLLMLPHTALFVAALGVADTWLRIADVDKMEEAGKNRRLRQSRDGEQDKDEDKEGDGS